MGAIGGHSGFTVVIHNNGRCVRRSNTFTLLALFQARNVCAPPIPFPLSVTLCWLFLAIVLSCHYNAMEPCRRLPLLHLLALGQSAYRCLRFWRVIYNGHSLWPILSVLILRVYVTFASATIDYRVFCVFIQYSSIFTVARGQEVPSSFRHKKGLVQFVFCGILHPQEVHRRLQWPIPPSLGAHRPRLQAAGAWAVVCASSAAQKPDELLSAPSAPPTRHAAAIVDIANFDLDFQLSDVDSDCNDMDTNGDMFL